MRRHGVRQRDTLVIEVDDTTLQGEGDSLGSVVDTELLHQVFEVDFDRLLGSPDDARDLLVAKPLRDEAQHLDLARAQPERRGRFARR